MILAPVTIRCPSNGRSASATFGLLAPAAQTSVGRAACSCLRWLVCYRAGLTAPPYSNLWPGHPSTHPQPLLFCGVGSLTPQPIHSTLAFLSAWATTAASSPAPRRPLPRPRRRPSPWCSRHGVVNVVKERLPSEEYCTWRA